MLPKRQWAAPANRGGADLRGVRAGGRVADAEQDRRCGQPIGHAVEPSMIWAAKPTSTNRMKSSHIERARLAPRPVTDGCHHSPCDSRCLSCAVPADHFGRSGPGVAACHQVAEPSPPACTWTGAPTADEDFSVRLSRICAIQWRSGSVIPAIRSYPTVTRLNPPACPHLKRNCLPSRQPVPLPVRITRLSLFMMKSASRTQYRVAGAYLDAAPHPSPSPPA